MRLTGITRKDMPIYRWSLKGPAAPMMHISEMGRIPMHSAD